MASRRDRFVRHWLAPLALVVVAGLVATVLAVFANSWWVDRDRPPSSDQRASDGSSLFTGPGVDYVSATGILLVRVGDESLPAAELGLDDDGERTVDPEIPLQVRILGDDGAFVLESADLVRVTTEDGRVARVETEPWGAANFRELIALLESRAENVGWTADDLAWLQDDLTTAQREGDGEVYSAELTGRSDIGATVSARITVDLPAARTVLTIVVTPSR